MTAYTHRLVGELPKKYTAVRLFPFSQPWPFLVDTDLISDIYDPQILRGVVAGVLCLRTGMAQRLFDVSPATMLKHGALRNYEVEVCERTQTRSKGCVEAGFWWTGALDILPGLGLPFDAEQEIARLQAVRLACRADKLKKLTQLREAFNTVLAMVTL